MTSQLAGIPGLFSTDFQNQSSTSSSAPSLFASSGLQTQSSLTGVNLSDSTSDGVDKFIHLRGSGLIVELANEKENLDSRFAHSKRLIDEGVQQPRLF